MNDKLNLNITDFKPTHNFIFNNNTNDWLVKLNFDDLTVDYNETIPDVKMLAFKNFFDHLMIHGKTMRQEIEELKNQNAELLEKLKRV